MINKTQASLGRNKINLTIIRFNNDANRAKIKA
ncbi:hypothetical protein GB2207_00565 [marine gamma proteobacterium HTCC2207]|uniref:Uncharacterized protein n=1 Tax=gamma proteobacterium HTCC2207 TaxID=314287 RepID=Q1YQ23_9GAMM|nr:hypothetical protein GB2207_00565 [marine gamma proteobacterium HTCC2207] [gamma proteobacterium HTCC2207]